MGYRLRWPKKNLTHCPGWVDHYRTMADKELREARKEAKNLWQRVSSIEGMSRNQAYEWLAKKMGIPKQECHFGHFDLERCEIAFSVCDKHIFGGAHD